MTLFNLEDLQRLSADPEASLALREESKRIQSSPNIVFLPCHLQFVRSIKGCFYLGFIIFTWAYNSYFIPEIVLLPQYRDGSISCFPVLCYYMVSICTLVSLFRAVTSDPGRLPFDLMPTPADKLNWTHCQRCLIQRPLKSHHCRKCQRCVRRMDHHCFWINNCVGEDNQWIFLLLVFYALLLSLYTLVLDTLHFYYFPTCMSCDSLSFLFRHQRYLMYLSCILGVTLTSLAGSQVLQQTINILSNRSTVESIIHAHKPMHERPTVMTRSAYDSFRDVCGPGRVLWWFNPFRRHTGKPNVYYYQQTV
ncbi:probable palmitoyltransferase ZDHHC21 [Asterias rubens]|uniref:probable palmitoyltransferase ZDHHC21 n=1 Tax=Asterias rubens TaxID=7604 RepID=UPI0014559250|nr:probable palmitoyltransferase ZDHHC21 [Asterias rubens]